MYLQNINALKVKDKVLVKCDVCHAERIVMLQTAIHISKNNGLHLCGSCKSKITIKPQNKKEYWTNEKKEEHGLQIANNEKYQNGILDRDMSGENNGMFGKKMSKESIKKMSTARTGKTGEMATAWKGGEISILRCVKKICHTRYNWYFRVYQKDNFCCKNCGNKKKLDAHHVDPMQNIIKELCIDKLFETKHEQIEWLAEQPRVKDENLDNGKTLCRECHKKEHSNWGSHIPKIK